MTDDEARALALLDSVRWLAPYGPDLARALVAQGALARLGAGRWAQAEGDEETGLLVVVEGALDLYCQAPGDREVRIGHIGPGAAIGQTMRFGGGPRLVTAVCAAPSLVLRVSDAGLARIARDRPQVWQAVAAVVYLGSVTHYVVDLDAGGSLTVLRQNLQGSADQALSHSGQRVDLAWADEHVISLASSG